MSEQRKKEILRIIAKLEAELLKEFSQYSTKNLNNRLISYRQELKQS